MTLNAPPALKMLCVLDMPTAVIDRFRPGIAVVHGELGDAAECKPDIIFCSIRPYRLDRPTIEALPASVRMIVTYSVGHDHIDLVAARDRGIAVFNTPGVLADAVADAAMLLLLGAARRITESMALLRSGQWSGWTPDQLIGTELGGKTMGIFGMGAIGKRIAQRARGFGMEIAYHNRREIVGEAAAFFADPRELVSHSDAIMLAWPSAPETRRFIAADTLALAKASMILVNIGRGDLVDDDALIAALQDRRILAAGLDVFNNEPHIHPGYLGLPNVFLTPHIGSSTWTARLAMADVLNNAIRDHMAGLKPANRLA